MNSWERNSSGYVVPELPFGDVDIRGTLVLNEDGSDSADIRWESDNDTHAIFADASAEKLGLFMAGSTAIGGKFDVAPDTDNYAVFGRAWIGYDGATSDQARWGHYDQRGASDYAISQAAGGGTDINGSSGTSVQLRLSGTLYGELNATRWWFNANEADHDFRVSGDTERDLFYTDASTDRVGIGTATPAGQLHVDQSSTTGAIPVLYLDQADLDQPFIQFETTIGTGNAVEAVGAKTLTTTHFIMVELPGGLTRYIPAGTIA